MEQIIHHDYKMYRISTLKNFSTVMIQSCFFSRITSIGKYGGAIGVDASQKVNFTIASTTFNECCVDTKPNIDFKGGGIYCGLYNKDSTFTMRKTCGMFCESSFAHFYYIKVSNNISIYDQVSIYANAAFPMFYTSATDFSRKSICNELNFSRNYAVKEAGGSFGGVEGCKIKYSLFANNGAFHTFINFRYSINMLNTFFINNSVIESFIVKEKDATKIFFDNCYFGTNDFAAFSLNTPFELINCYLDSDKYNGHQSTDITIRTNTLDHNLCVLRYGNYSVNNTYNKASEKLEYINTYRIDIIDCLFEDMNDPKKSGGAIFVHQSDSPCSIIHSSCVKCSCKESGSAIFIASGLESLMVKNVLGKTCSALEGQFLAIIQNKNEREIASSIVFNLSSVTESSYFSSAPRFDTIEVSSKRCSGNFDSVNVSNNYVSKSVCGLFFQGNRIDISHSLFDSNKAGKNYLIEAYKCPITIESSNFINNSAQITLIYASNYTISNSYFDETIKLLINNSFAKEISLSLQKEFITFIASENQQKHEINTRLIIIICAGSFAFLILLIAFIIIIAKRRKIAQIEEKKYTSSSNPQ